VGWLQPPQIGRSGEVGMIEFAGFRIQFTFDHLKRVAHAYFGLYVEKQKTMHLINSTEILRRFIKILRH
jgi:hypothetical protein